MRIEGLFIGYLASLSLLTVMGLAGAAHGAPMSCSFVSGSTGAISFSTIDPTAAGTVYGTVTQQVSFTCTKNNAYTIAVAPASGWTLVSGANSIAYTLGIAASGTYPGTPVALLIPSGGGASSILQTNYANAPAGVYSNNAAITITVTYGGPGSPITATLPINSISGTVSNSCLVSGSPSLSWGTLDASMTGPYPAAAMAPVIKCTKSDSVTITSDYGVNRSGTQYRMKSGSNYISYTFNFTTPLSGAGGTTDIGSSLGMSASIPANALDNAPSGTYTDTITLTINY